MLAWKIWQQYLHLRADVTLGLELQSRVSCVDIVLHQKFPRSFSFVDLEDYVIVSWTWLHLSPNTSWVLELVIRQLVYLSCCSYNLRFFLGKVFFFLFQMQRVTGPTTTWSKLSWNISRQPGNSFSERPSRGLDFGNQSHTEGCSFQALNRSRDDLSLLVRNRGEWWVAWRCGTEKCWLRNKMLSFKWKTPYLMRHEVASLVTEQVINI